MSEHSYGVVVERYDYKSGIWLLFRGTEGHLSELNDHMCNDRLHLGDIIEARSDGVETRILRRTPSDSVWSDGIKVVVRTIASYDREITIQKGKYTDDETGIGFVILRSHDLGCIAAPVNWYNRNFTDVSECHVLAFAEYRPRPYTNALTDEPNEFSWSIVADRFSIPVIPSMKKNVEYFLGADEIHTVPALVIKSEERSLLLWSFALGNRVAILTNSSEIGEWIADVGQWMTVTVIPSSARDLDFHNCAYTVIKHDLVIPYSQPEIEMVFGRPTMTVEIRRNALDSDVGVKLWHDYWGLPIEYDAEKAEWIKCERDEFKAIVKVELCEDDDPLRVSITATGPVPAPRSSSPKYPPIVLPKFEDVAILKSALHQADISSQSEGHDDTRSSTGIAESAMCNNNNIDEDLATCKAQAAQAMTKPGWSDTHVPTEAYDEGWLEKAKKMEDESDTRSFSPSSFVRSDSRASTGSRSSDTSKKSGLNWGNWGKNEEKKDKEEEKEQQQEKNENQDNNEEIKKRNTNMVWTADKGWNYDKTTMQATGAGRGDYGRGRGTGYGFSTGRRPTPSTGPSGRGWGAPMPQVAPKVETVAQTTSNDGGSKNEPAVFTPILKPKADSGFDAENIVGPVPIRAFEDMDAKKKFRVEMEKKGYIFPPEIKPVIIPDGEDGWDQCSAPYTCVGVKKPEPTMPVAELIKKRTIVRDAMRLKQLQCVIVRVRFDFHWKYADKIQLFVLDGTPAYVVHKMDNKSYLRNREEFLTVGNVVECNIGRNAYGYYVHDEMWRYITKIKMPMREHVFEDGRCKTLHLISDAKCLSPECQDRHNDRWRYYQRGFTMLSDELLHNIVYFGKNIDAREHEEYNFQVVVVPEEELKQHAFWKATEVLMRVRKELPVEFGPGFPNPPMLTKTNFPPLKPSPPVDVEFKASLNTHNPYVDTRISFQLTYPRETRLEELFYLYGKLMENDKLMQQLLLRTGTDYKKKFQTAIEVAQTSMPHQKSMKRELQVNADFLISIFENVYAEEIFKECGEKRLWKLLVKTSDSVKAFRSTVNNRYR